MCQVYNWWGTSTQPPPHLKTKKQLALLGLKPLNPVGVIYTKKYDLYLYDPENIESSVPKKKICDAQKQALATGREKQRRKREYEEWYEYCGRFIEDRNAAILWAKKLLETNDWIILDFETTGLSDAEIVQIGIIDHKGKTILDSFVKPTIPIPDNAIAIHGITNETVVNAPSFPEIYPQIVESLKDKKVLIYNAAFDISILKYCCNLYNLPLLGLRKKSECVMEWYAQYYGEYSDYWDDYKWQPLNGSHNAIADCQATIELIKVMAASLIEDTNFNQ